MKTDFLLLYEGRAREIESLCLLSEELKTRGYSCIIKNIYDPIKYYIKPEVLVVPHLYNDDQLMQFCNNRWHGCKKVLSLQWEQVLSKGSSKNNIHNPKGQAKNAHHIAWGDVQVERYKGVGIENGHIWKTGSMSMDLLRPEFDEYFLSKEEVAKACGLSADKEWVLFISSFSYANLTEEIKKQWETLNPKTRVFAELSQKSFDIVTDWIIKAAKENPDKLFIYRRHPAELSSTALEAKFSSVPNLFLIEKFSMRQWVKVANRFYNWYSTSIADVYYSCHSNFLLRPIEIPDYLDIDIFDDLHKIKTYEEFENSLKEETVFHEISSVRSYYGERTGRMAYQKTADVCEGLYKREIESYDYQLGNSPWYNLHGQGDFLYAVKSWINYALFKYCCYFKIEKLHIFRSKQHSIDIWKKDIYGIKDNIKDYSDRLRPFVKHIYENGKK